MEPAAKDGVTISKLTETSPSLSGSTISVKKLFELVNNNDAAKYIPAAETKSQASYYNRNARAKRHRPGIFR